MPTIDANDEILPEKPAPDSSGASVTELSYVLGVLSATTTPIAAATQL